MRSHISSLTYKPFPVETLPPSMQTFVTQGARATGCDPVAIALPALCAVAGILGGACRLQVKSTWQAPPILWGCLLGESGSRKSPAMRLALAPLREYEKAAHSESQTASPPWVQASSLYTKTPPRRLLVSDTTADALAQIAQENPLGLLLARDELAGFFGDIEQYGGGEEAFYLSAYDGEQVTLDRKTNREHIFVPQAALSIIGTCQPAVFARLMKLQRRESGFLARFLVVEPPTSPSDLPDESLDDSILDNWRTTIARLLTFNSQINLTLDEDSQALYRDFFRAHNEAAKNETGDWRAFLAKAEQLPLRLALVLHHIHLAEESESPSIPPHIPTRSVSKGSPSSHIPAHTMASSIQLTRWFIQEAQRVYYLLSATPEERLAYELESWIRQAQGGKTTVTQIKNQAPAIFHDQLFYPQSLLQILEHKSRGEWHWVIMPVVMTGHIPYGNCENTFHLYPLRQSN
jgi:hypothetical protein